jgi:hypothetical protein
MNGLIGPRRRPYDEWALRQSALGEARRQGAHALLSYLGRYAGCAHRVTARKIRLATARQRGRHTAWGRRVSGG